MKQKTFVKKGTLFLFIFLLSLFFISLVSAQPPPTIQTNVNINVGLQVQTQGISTLEQNMNHTFSFHVYNISTGFLLDDTTTDCAFHLYNKRGENQFDANDLSFVAEGFVIELYGSNFSGLGTYSYYVHCNTSTYGGFAREVLEVTPTGFQPNFSFYIIILLISAVLIIWGFSIRDPWVIIFGTFGLYFTGLYIMLNGIVGIKDMVTTWAIALILLGVAAYLSIRAAQEVMNG